MPKLRISRIISFALRYATEFFKCSTNGLNTPQVVNNYFKFRKISVALNFIYIHTYIPKSRELIIFFVTIHINVIINIKFMPTRAK